MKVYTCFPEGKAKALTMSYDDGKLQDERLVAIFNQYGIKGTFNINYELMRTEQEEGKKPQYPRLPMDRIKELYKGHEVATHTMTHPTIERCPLVEVAQEILEDRKNLERLTGGLVRGHAYPNGSYSEEIKQLFRQLGIAYGRVVESVPNYALPKDPMEWHPTCHHNDPELMKKAEFFANFQKRQYLKLMYVWGHSYEFTQHNNWDVMERFCDLVGGREDTWYATNIEIVDYMEDARRLQFTAAGDAVYNPAFQSVWIEVDGDRLEIPGGQLVRLD